MAKKRLIRLLTILLFLKSNKSVTADFLSKKLKTTKRTIYRDVKNLISNGIPIYSSPGPQGGYILNEDYPIDPLIYSESEELHLLLGSKKQRHSQKYSDIFQQAIDILGEKIPKIEKKLIEKVDKYIIYDTTKWFWHEKLNIFRAIKDAVISNKIIKISYYERDSFNIKSNLIDPYGLVWKEGYWYLVGLSHAPKRYQRIRLKRIIEVEITNQKFLRPSSFDLHSFWKTLLEEFGKGTVRIKLKLSRKIIKNFNSFNWKTESKIKKKTDYALVELFVDSYEWIIPLIMTYAGEIEVIEPQELKLDILFKAQQIILRHKRANKK